MRAAFVHRVRPQLIRCLGNINFPAMKFNHLTCPYLTTLTKFHVSINLHRARCNRGFCHAPAIAQPHDFQEVMQLDKLFVLKFKLVHCYPKRLFGTRDSLYRPACLLFGAVGQFRTRWEPASTECDHVRGKLECCCSTLDSII